MSRTPQTKSDPTPAEIAKWRQRLNEIERQQKILSLIADAKLAVETIETGKSIVFRKASAEWLEQIAKSLRVEMARKPGTEVPS